MKRAVNQFEDRRDAGRLLAGELAQYKNRDDVIVLGLPRGGVVVAFEVARALHLPLDALVVRKLGVPGWEELGMGAVSCGGVRVLNDDIVRRARISEAQIEAVTARELQELHRREMAFRGSTDVPDIPGKAVLLIDDGIATGSTILAAVKVLRAHNPTAVIIGVPTASTEARDMLEPAVDEFVSLIVPEEFRSVGEWYRDFEQTSDDEVIFLLRAAKDTALAGDGDR